MRFLRVQPGTKFFVIFLKFKSLPRTRWRDFLHFLIFVDSIYGIQ